MADIFTKAKRSEVMSKIRSKGTAIERDAFRYLKDRGLNFRKHYKNVAGSPDIAIPKKKKAVFIDGDFWHGWKFQKRRKKLPKIYWRDKIEKNIKRDEINRKALRRDGWKVMRIWEHQLKKDQPFYLEKIRKFLLR
jgi:DNA mismatch endonuclease (patch repair protein)